MKAEQKVTQKHCFTFISCYSVHKNAKKYFFLSYVSFVHNEILIKTFVATYFLEFIGNVDYDVSLVFVLNYWWIVTDDGEG